MQPTNPLVHSRDAPTRKLQVVLGSSRAVQSCAELCRLASGLHITSVPLSSFAQLCAGHSTLAERSDGRELQPTIAIFGTSPGAKMNV